MENVSSEIINDEELKENPSASDQLSTDEDGLFVVGELRQKMKRDGSYQDFARLAPFLHDKFRHELHTVAEKLGIKLSIKTILKIEKGE